jgi:hypothetical protein
VNADCCAILYQQLAVAAKHAPERKPLLFIWFFNSLKRTGNCVAFLAFSSSVCFRTIGREVAISSPIAGTRGVF